MSPSLLLSQGETRLVLGSGGSKRIRTAMLQVISLVVDFGLPLADAVTHPRVHWDGACVQAEPGIGAEALAELSARRPSDGRHCQPRTLQTEHYASMLFTS